MLSGDWAAAHSLLSVPLNLGAAPLTPCGPRRRPTATAAMPRWPQPGASSARSWAGGGTCGKLYWRFGPAYLDGSSLGAHNPLPDWWADLDAEAVDAECLRQATTGVRDRGWAHHRPAADGARQPRPAARVPTRGRCRTGSSSSSTDSPGWDADQRHRQSQHAGWQGRWPTSPTPPVARTSSKMSDHCRHCRSIRKKRLGPDACPFTAGYWAFVHRHADLLAAQHALPVPFRR